MLAVFVDALLQRRTNSGQHSRRLHVRVLICGHGNAVFRRQTQHTVIGTREVQKIRRKLRVHHGVFKGSPQMQRRAVQLFQRKRVLFRHLTAEERLQKRVVRIHDRNRRLARVELTVKHKLL